MDLIKIVLVCTTPNGSLLRRFEFSVWKFRRVSLLKEYFERVLCLSGTIQLDSRANTLEGIKSGDIVEIKNCYQKPKKLHSLSLTVYPQVLQCDVSIPETITIELLKFVIECEHGILMGHQVLKRNREIWRHNNHSEYAIKDLEGLEIEDISKYTHDLSPIMFTESTASNVPVLFLNDPDIGQCTCV